MTPPMATPTAQHGFLALPDTFLAFYALRHELYLRYACLRLDTATAEQAVRETFGALAITWPLVLRGANPPAHAWNLFHDHIRNHTPRTRRRARTTGPHPATHRLLTPDDDITLLRQLGCTPARIADLTGLPTDTIRALLTHPATPTHRSPRRPRLFLGRAAGTPPPGTS